MFQNRRSSRRPHAASFAGQRWKSEPCSMPHFHMSSIWPCLRKSPPPSMRAAPIVPNLPSAPTSSVTTVPANGDVQPFRLGGCPRGVPRRWSDPRGRIPRVKLQQQHQHSRHRHDHRGDQTRSKSGDRTRFLHLASRRTRRVIDRLEEWLRDRRQRPDHRRPQSGQARSRSSIALAKWSKRCPTRTPTRISSTGHGPRRSMTRVTRPSCSSPMSRAARSRESTSRS